MLQNNEKDLWWLHSPLAEQGSPPSYHLLPGGIKPGAAGVANTPGVNEEAATASEDLRCGAWMSQEVSKWLVNVL